MRSGDGGQGTGEFGIDGASILFPFPVPRPSRCSSSTPTLRSEFPRPPVPRPQLPVPTLSQCALSSTMIKLIIGTMTERSRDPDTLLPLKPVELLIVTMLSAGDRHGYGIRQDIIDHTSGRIALEAGNLYRHIRRLQGEGLVDETEPRALASDGGERR